jgi:ubiquinone/menaquinone biosynthesis C-methylase UbiE
VRVVGVDPSSQFVSAAQRAGDGDRVRFQVGDASALPFPSAGFDRTLSLLVLNFVPDTAAAVREMIRVTRPNGVVAAAVGTTATAWRCSACWEGRMNRRADGMHMPLSVMESCPRYGVTLGCET